MTGVNLAKIAPQWQPWERMLLGIGFLFLPMQEGPQTIAWYALVLAIMFRDKTWILSSDHRRRWMILIGGLLLLALGVGTVAALWHGYDFRSSKASRVFSGCAVLIGLKLTADKHEDEWRMCWWFFLAGLMLSSLAGLSQFFFGSFPFEYLWEDSARGWQGQLYIPGTQTPCASGLHRNRMRFAEILIMSFTMLFSYRGPVWKMMSPWFVVIIAGVTALTAYLTYSWMAVYVSLGGWLLTFVLKSTRQIWVARLAMLGSVAGMFLVPIIGSVLRNLQDNPALPTGKLEIRQWLWSTGLDGFMENPLIGKGFGGYGQWAMEHLGIHASNVRDPHSWWIATSTQAGSAGVLVMALIAAIFLLFAWRIKQSDLSTHFAPGHTEVLAGCCALMAMGMVQDIFFYHGFAQFTWLVVGLALGLTIQGLPEDTGSSKSG